MAERRSPLIEAHRAAGARLVDFAGWEMPLHYGNGTLAEHLACRSDAVMFDVSHLGTVRVSGRDAFSVLQRALSNDLRRIGPGQAQYTHLLDTEDGSVVDDIIVWWTGEDQFDVMPNASNTSRVVAALAEESAADGGSGRRRLGGSGSGSQAPSGAGADSTPGFSMGDVTSSRAVIAVQGPRARERLSRIGADAADAAEVGRFQVAEASVGGVQVTVAGTGYTGEDGVELAVPAEHCAAVWQSLSDAAVAPAGLGARDTLRLEAGLPLHGNDLGPGITPLQAGLGWAVRFDKEDFRGRGPLEAEKREGPRRLSRGLLGETRRPPRKGCAVYREGGSGSRAGVVTSGNFSPVLGKGIALALLDRDCALGDRMVIDVRGSELEARVVRPPFHSL